MSELNENPANDFSFFKEMTARFKTAFDLHIPVGYEDNAGFHFGAQTAPREFEI